MKEDDDYKLMVSTPLITMGLSALATLILLWSNGDPLTLFLPIMSQLNLALCIWAVLALLVVWFVELYE